MFWTWESREERTVGEDDTSPRAAMKVGLDERGVPAAHDGTLTPDQQIKLCGERAANPCERANMIRTELRWSSAECPCGSHSRRGDGRFQRSPFRKPRSLGEDSRHEQGRRHDDLRSRQDRHGERPNCAVVALALLGSNSDDVLGARLLPLGGLCGMTAGLLLVAAERCFSPPLLCLLFRRSDRDKCRWFNAVSFCPRQLLDV